MPVPATLIEETSCTTLVAANAAVAVDVIEDAAVSLLETAAVPVVVIADAEMAVAAAATAAALVPVRAILSL